MLIKSQDFIIISYVLPNYFSNTNEGTYVFLILKITSLNYRIIIIEYFFEK